VKQAGFPLSATFEDLDLSPSPRPRPPHNPRTRPGTLD
jgi:hypothetical protein